jgi:hypothetical protein
MFESTYDSEPSSLGQLATQAEALATAVAIDAYLAPVAKATHVVHPGPITLQPAVTEAIQMASSTAMDAAAPAQQPSLQVR